MHILCDFVLITNARSTLPQFPKMASAVSDADRQINQMMEFIMEEANEKAEEIRQKATAEYESMFQELKREVE